MAVAVNGRHGVSKEVDRLEANKAPNQRLLDPTATPANLMTYGFGVGIPMPTRTCTRDTAIALRALAMPMFGNAHYYSPDSLEVGEARNEIVRRALEDGVKWLFFMDYDVSPPPNALIKLLNLDVDIAAGVYHAKQVPSYPLILVRGWPYAFDNYEVGDLIKVDGCGMGCTLIRMDVFKNIEPPWFKTVGHTTEDGSQILPMLTEDIYFCDKARAAGYEIIVDTSIQAGHVDWTYGITYHMVDESKDSRKPLPGWTYRMNGKYVTGTLMYADHPGRKWADTTPLKGLPKNPPLDLGSGMTPRNGWLGVDPFVDPETPNVVKKDMRDLSWYREEYGLCPEMVSWHSLEHLPYRDVPATVRDWVKTLAPGGKITITVPDGEMYMRSLLRRIDKGEDDSYETLSIQNGLFGDQMHEGQFHKSIFTMRSLKSLGVSVGLSNVEVSRQSMPRQKGFVPETAHLVLTAERAK